MQVLMTGAPANYVVDFTEEIDRGVEWLDRQDPLWFDYINLDALDLTSGQQCVLGQLAMSTFVEQIDRARAKGKVIYSGYDGVLGAHNLGAPWAEEHGFNIDHYRVARLLDVEEDDISDPDDLQNKYVWESLTIQWAERIRSLRLRVQTDADVAEIELAANERVLAAS